MVGIPLGQRDTQTEQYADLQDTLQTTPLSLSSVDCAFFSHLSSFTAQTNRFHARHITFRMSNVVRSLSSVSGHSRARLMATALNLRYGQKPLHVSEPLFSLRSMDGGLKR